MPVTTTLALVGLGLTAAGTATNMYGQAKQASASKKAENIRRQQMRVQADRERRQAIREGMQARASANTNLTQGGAQFGSAFGGGVGQVVSNTGQRVSDTNINQNLGEAMFRANDKLSQGKMISGIGSAVGDLGKALFANAEPLNRVAGQFGVNGSGSNSIYAWGGYNGAMGGFGMGR